MEKFICFDQLQWLPTKQSKKNRLSAVSDENDVWMDGSVAIWYIFHVMLKREKAYTN